MKGVLETAFSNTLSVFTNLVDDSGTHLPAELPQLVPHARRVALAVEAAGELVRPTVEVAARSCRRISYIMLGENCARLKGGP